MLCVIVESVTVDNAVIISVVLGATTFIFQDHEDVTVVFGCGVGIGEVCAINEFFKSAIL